MIDPFGRSDECLIFYDAAAYEYSIAPVKAPRDVALRIDLQGKRYAGRRKGRRAEDSPIDVEIWSKKVHWYRNLMTEHSIVL